MAKINILLNIGYNNFVAKAKIVSILGADTAPVKRLKNEAGRHNKLIDATNGRKTRTVIVTADDHVVLSSIMPETIAERLEGNE